MFTGIVQSTGEVKSIISGDNFKHFVIKVPLELIANLTIGASVANNGVCLTAVKFEALDEEFAQIEFDVIDETLRLTNLNEIEVGSQINIERSLKAGDEIGGHMVSGHIHTMATLVERVDSADNCKLTFSIDSAWHKYIFAKGFIGVNGASLTLGNVVADEQGETIFDLHLIPETLERTNLGELEVGKPVNIEIDQQTITIVDSIARIMKDRSL
ncbi:riboflavin synthase subunit alpha [Thalassomonas sp. M1454]|uniref:riboflavin synthase subunit alpha n=1 Tax=Thalassomonas sp. M1454 TaxID=2594477 RepID=UPI00117FAE90|nr:riboflavin synthase subunit alpha [Thalassomonas sp. M1454]TRX56735.1 riboflavin synthase subunit alpha [Thalassomonas sp. M1454]